MRGNWHQPPDPRSTKRHAYPSRIIRQGAVLLTLVLQLVEHAGYVRSIISRNPPLVDDEGYEPESDDEDYEQRMHDIVETAAEFNPYANVRLESELESLDPLDLVTPY